MSIQIAEHAIIFTEEEDNGVRVIIQHPAGPQTAQNDELISDPQKRRLLAGQLRAAADLIARQA
jgi:hypothetical protein